jgi:molybdopterin biosynthesis enzyme MoaB
VELVTRAIEELEGVAVTVTVTGTGFAPGAVTVDVLKTVSISGTAEEEDSPSTLTTS